MKIIKSILGYSICGIVGHIDNYSKYVDDFMSAIILAIKNGTAKVEKRGNYFLYVSIGDKKYSIWITNEWYGLASRVDIDGVTLYNNLRPSYATLYDFYKIVIQYKEIDEHPQPIVNHKFNFTNE